MFGKRPPRRSHYPFGVAGGVCADAPTRCRDIHHRSVAAFLTCKPGSCSPLHCRDGEIPLGTDTAIAASRLIFGGVVADTPELKICLAHGGGTFFWALARIAFMWDQQASVTAEQLTRNVFVDSVVYQQPNLRYLCERIGAARILFGTDYPLPAQADMQGAILAGLPDADVARIGGLNASSLLGICPTCQ